MLLSLPISTLAILHFRARKDWSYIRPEDTLVPAAVTPQDHEVSTLPITLPTAPNFQSPPDICLGWTL